MDIQVHVGEDSIHGRTERELQRDLQEGLVILDYINARLSAGEIAVKLGMQYVQARNWLHGKGINTLKKMDRDLENIAHENTERLMSRLKKPSRI